MTMRALGQIVGSFVAVMGIAGAFWVALVVQLSIGSGGKYFVAELPWSYPGECITLPVTAQLYGEWSRMLLFFMLERQ